MCCCICVLTLFQGLQTRIKGFLTSELHLAQALECLTALREGALSIDMETEFNVFLTSLKASSLWSSDIQTSLIHEEECAGVGVSKQESVDFLLVKQEEQKEVVELVQTQQQEEEDDLLDMMD